jgi:hypothetical protein
VISKEEPVSSGTWNPETGQWENIPDVITGTTTLIPHNLPTSKDMYITATLAPNGRIYCPPASGSDILIIE